MRTYVTFGELDRIRPLSLEEQLKPCPFCGGRAEFRKAMNDQHHGVRCTDCKAQSALRGAAPVSAAGRAMIAPRGSEEREVQGKRRALELWNRRASE